jgi:hypothetical protein
MRNDQHARNSAAKCCAICGGKFGLVRYYSWRAAFCSKKCLGRFRARRERDRRWLWWPQVARRRVCPSFVFSPGRDNRFRSFLA